MSNNLKMIVFVILLGLITSLFLMGMDLLTADRIEANRQAKFKSIILNANNISFNYGNIHDVFDDRIDTIEKIIIVDDRSISYFFYQDKASKNISFEFIGDGVWGKISGIITLDESFIEIINISILAQVETPGLGGIIAERKYLNTFNGIIFIDDQILITRKDNVPNEPNQVDAISGATRTSNSFSTIINTSYASFKNAWISGTEVEA